MDKATLKEIREHCDRQCVRYGMNKDSDYYKEHYLIRELLDEINCDLAEHDKKIMAEVIEKYTDWLFNEGYIGLHWNNPTNAIQNLLNKYKEQIQKGE